MISLVEYFLLFLRRKVCQKTARLLDALNTGKVSENVKYASQKFNMLPSPKKIVELKNIKCIYYFAQINGGKLDWVFLTQNQRA